MKQTDKKNIFNKVLTEILDFLGLNAIDLGLNSEYRSRALPDPITFNKSIEACYEFFSKALIGHPQEYLLACGELFTEIKNERKKYNLDIDLSTAYDSNDDSISTLDRGREKKSYASLVTSVRILKEKGEEEISKNDIINFLVNVLKDAYHIAKMTKGLVGCIIAERGNKRKIQIDPKIKPDEYKEIFNFNNNGYVIPKIGDAGNKNKQKFAQQYFDVSSFAPIFSRYYKIGYYVSLLEDNWDNKEKRNELIEEIISLGPEDLEIPDTFNTLRESILEYISNINVRGDVSSAIIGLMVGAANKEEIETYLNLFPDNFLIDKNALIAGVERVRNLKLEDQIKSLFNLCVPVDLVLKREAMFRGFMENIAFCFESERDLDNFLSTMYLNVLATQNIDELILLYNVGTAVDMMSEDEFQIRKKYRIWPTMFSGFESQEEFNADCIDCFNYFSLDAETREAAIITAKQALNMHQITKNEKGMEICTNVLFQLYMSSDEDYLMARESFLSPEDGDAEAIAEALAAERRAQENLEKSRTRAREKVNRTLIEIGRKKI